METAGNKVNRRRLAGAYVSSVLSISLVLVLVGIAALLSVNARSVSDYFKEKLLVSVLLKQEATQKTTERYQKSINNLPFINSTRLVTKEEGTAELKKILGEDFLEVFEASPVPFSIDITLKAEYVHPDSLQAVIAALSQDKLVEEVACQQSLVEALNSNLAKITLILSVFIALMLFVSFVLIANVIRISVFSNRFSIHTMKLVGATRAFIRAPYLRFAVIQGVISAVAAMLLIAGGLLLLNGRFPQIFEVFRTSAFVKSGLAVLASGVLICFISTYFTVNKLISMNRGDLYF